MSDAWLDLLRLAVMGAVGLGGAWLGAQATRRKEWWRHRRELYQPILLSLMDLYIHSRHRLRLEEESDPADPKSQAQLNEVTEKAVFQGVSEWCGSKSGADDLWVLPKPVQVLSTARWD